jgi:hypothetical protein
MPLGDIQQLGESLLAEVVSFPQFLDLESNLSVINCWSLA